MKSCLINEQQCFIGFKIFSFFFNHFLEKRVSMELITMTLL